MAGAFLSVCFFALLASIQVYISGRELQSFEKPIVEGYQTINHCLGPYTQVDAEVIGSYFDQAVDKAHWSIVYI